MSSKTYLDLSDLDPADDQDVGRLVSLLAILDESNFAFFTRQMLVSGRWGYGEEHISRSKEIIEGFETTSFSAADDVIRYTLCVAQQQAFYPYSLLVKYLKIASLRYVRDHPEDSRC